MSKESQIEQLKGTLGGVLAAEYESFLLTHNGGTRPDGLLLYDASEIQERNHTFEVQRFAPEFLGVGDDSGGRLVVIRFADKEAAPFLVDAGALTPNMPPSLLKPLAATWGEWAKRGFPLPQ